MHSNTRTYLQNASLSLSPFSQTRTSLCTDCCPIPKISKREAAAENATEEQSSSIPGEETLSEDSSEGGNGDEGEQVSEPSGGSRIRKNQNRAAERNSRKDKKSRRKKK